jgi:hypothetical protein
MKKLILFVVLIMMMMLACSVNVISTPAPSIQLPPSAVIPPVTRSSIETVLINNGFSRWTDGDNYCSTSCKAYAYLKYGMIVHAYSDGSSALGKPLVDDNTASTIFGTVIFQAFGETSLGWMADHLQASLYEDQIGYANNYRIVMTIDVTDDPPFIIILFTPN